MRMHLFLAVVLASGFAGCASSDEQAPSPSTANAETGAEAGFTQTAGTRVEHIDADLSYKAWIYECKGPYAVLEWDYLLVDVAHAVAGDLNFTWKASGPLATGMVFGFTSGPNGPVYADVQGGSPVRWRFSGDIAQAIHEADRLEPLGPVCSETTPGHAAIDITVHVEGSIWSA